MTECWPRHPSDSTLNRLGLEREGVRRTEALSPSKLGRLGPSFTTSPVPYLAPRTYWQRNTAIAASTPFDLRPLEGVLLEFKEFISLTHCDPHIPTYPFSWWV